MMGREFVLKLISPRRWNCVKTMELEQLINVSDGIVQVHDIEISLGGDWNIQRLKDGKEHKRKSYRAVLWLSQELPLILDYPFGPFEILQKTPLRVCHRRSMLERTRIIHSLSFERISAKYLLMNLETEAGTYIKEFVHGDRGRSEPSVSSILGCRCDILQLDVISIT